MGLLRFCPIAEGVWGGGWVGRRQKAPRWGDKDFNAETEIIKSITGEQLEQDSSWQQHLGVRHRQPGAALLLRLPSPHSPPDHLHPQHPPRSPSDSSGAPAGALAGTSSLATAAAATLAQAN